ncbi:MAG TPA: signal peptide peptidase SppA [Candidatus Eisenbacteria bacterium]
MTSRTLAWLGCGLVVLFLFGVGVVLMFSIGFMDDGEFPKLGRKVAVVGLTGTIVSSDRLVKTLAEMGEDDAIEAVVLRIDSPGGGIAPSQEIHDALIRLRARKPVIASMANTAASGGYYVAVACDSIMANPGSLTGSIGVIFSWMTAEELMRKVGVRMEVVKSGPNKDMGSFAREPTDEERRLLEGVVNDAYQQFIDAVTAGRALSRDEVLALADGRVFTGRQALELGLVDRLGGQREAVEWAARMAGIEGEPVVVDRGRSRIPWADWLEESSRTVLPDVAGPRLEYRFR